VVWNLCGLIHSAVQSIDDPSCGALSQQTRASEGFCFSMHKWSLQKRLAVLSFFERKLLRSVSNSSVDLSFSSYRVFLNNAMTALSHPADVGCVEQRRKCDLLWQVYLQCETVHVSLLFPDGCSGGGDEDRLWRCGGLGSKSDLAAVKLRLGLLLTGEASGCRGGGSGGMCFGASVAGRDLGVLQGGARSRRVVLSQSLGDLLLGHISFEIFARDRSELEIASDVAHAEHSIREDLVCMADRYGVILRAREL
jgi:hypothetical protein